MLSYKAITERLFAHPFAKQIAFGVIALCGLWIAVNLITTLITVFSSPMVNNASEPVQAFNQQTAKELADVPKWHIFGQAPTILHSTETIPLSHLNLKLIGVFLNTDHDQSKALITDASGHTQLYGIGDMMPGGVKVYEIFPDNVVIKRDGELEKLTLPNRELKFNPPPAGLP